MYRDKMRGAVEIALVNSPGSSFLIPEGWARVRRKYLPRSSRKYTLNMQVIEIYALKSSFQVSATRERGAPPLPPPPFHISTLADAGCVWRANESDYGYLVEASISVRYTD